MTNNENIIYAPIEIESEEQLRDLGYTWQDCRTWKIGVTPVKVLLVPADEATRDFLYSELLKKYDHVTRRDRCVVPGTRKAWIQCPEKNHCEDCPFGRNAGDRGPVVLSLDVLMGEGFDLISYESVSDIAERQVEMETVMRRLWEANPQFPKIVVQRAEGFTAEEIAQNLGVCRATLYRFLQQIREIASA